MDTDTRRELTPEEVELFKFQSSEWSLCNGFAYKDGMAPHCTPGGIPEKLVSGVINVSPLFNKMVHLVSQNLDFMLEAHKDVPDSFTQSLIQICVKVREAGGDGQPVQFGIFRSDYMLHQPEGTVLHAPFVKTHSSRPKQMQNYFKLKSTQFQPVFLL